MSQSSHDGTARTRVGWQFRADVEGLRAIAILLVILFHSGVIHGGFLGVDVFFVLSGFLITGILLDEVERTGTVSLANFWARRARRLLPAAALISVVTIVLGSRLVGPHAQAENARTAEAFSLYGSNVLFAKTSADYFARKSTDDPLLHTWSLSIEEQFYLCFAPLLLWLAVRARAGGLERFRGRFRSVTIALSVLSFIACIVALQLSPMLLASLPRRMWGYLIVLPTVAFYGLPTRAWEFGIGALTVFYAARLRERPSAAISALGVGSLIILCGSALFVGIRAMHPLYVTVLPTLSTAGLLVAGGIAPRSWVPRLLSTAPMRAVGRWSYSWYLWHWPLLVFLGIRYPSASIGLRFAVAAAALIPAVVAYRVVESPVRHSRLLQRRRRETLLGAVGLSVLVFAIAAASQRHALNVMRQEPYRTIEAARNARPTYYREGCDGLDPGHVPERCVYGAPESDTTVVLIGDSHARHWFPALERAASGRWRLIPLTRGGCLLVPVPGSESISARMDACARWRASTVSHLTTLHPTVVVLGGLARDDHALHSPVTRAAYQMALRETWGRVAASGARLVVLRDTPYPAFDVPDCLELRPDSPQSCEFGRAASMSAVFDTIQRQVAHEITGVSYVDLTNAFCNATRCAAMQAGIVRYHDFSHVSVPFAASLGPLLAQPIDAVLKGAGGAVAVPLLRGSSARTGPRRGLNSVVSDIAGNRP